jgi:hypothetical protein
MKDTALWTADVSTMPGASFTVDVTAHDGTGAPAANAIIVASAMHDDFMLTAEVKGMTDASGHVVLTLPPTAQSAGSGNRFIHVTAGPVYPLAEQIVALP